MGSGASVSEASRPERSDPREAEPEPVRPSSPAGRSDDTLQAEEEEEEAATPDSHIIDVQSLQREVKEEEEEEEEEEDGEGAGGGATQTVLSPAVTETAAEGEEVSLDFESFLHVNGTLYSCFHHQGDRVYVDESQNLQPFPKDWYDQGRFLSARDEGSGQLQAPGSGGEPAFREDDRTASIYIQGKGTVMTYMFEERVNVCRFWDPPSGVWLLLPLQWEVDVDFVKARVQRVTSALPGLVDQKEIAAALRQCNYDPEEVISVYLTMFGEILLQASPGGDPENYTDLNSFSRALLERDRLIEDLRQKLQTKEKESDDLFQRNSFLAREVRHLSDVVQHLNQKLAELEADQQEARERIRSLLHRRAPAVPPARTVAKPPVDPGRLRRVRGLSRELNVSNKQLRSTVRQAMADVQNQLEQLKGAAGQLAQVEQQAAGEVEELRTLYRREAVERKGLYNKLLELQGNIRVFCRCRKSSTSGSCVETADDQELVVVQRGSRKKFHFDRVYPQSSTQEEVFAGTLPVITSCVDGYNVCILAYGQTGSGKTYTMMGDKENPGVNIRSVRELLRICAGKETVSYTLKISMLEIYNDTLNDLLTKGGNAALDIRVQGKSVSAPGLTRIQVRTEADILGVMEMGEKNRKIASTKMNIQSTDQWYRPVLTNGTDQWNRPVFGALRCNALHVPFRNSKLTHLLQPSLSGDAKCCVFVNVSPDVTDAAETLSTLQFGAAIRQVSLGKATRNVAPAKNKETGGK
ncbi:hypothetical protein F2P81_006685 [Scophthalmus maximus]|uniref:Kinesin motor domain-containing protein n=1 Tax=Scophthalmus maximus TaxID=52904 RepID=A0A6A4T3R5_SCOMX|nr:hypothetical protein F2P81_006685 [Scophthalmus maximus]